MTGGEVRILLETADELRLSNVIKRWRGVTTAESMDEKNVLKNRLIMLETIWRVHFCQCFAFSWFVKENIFLSISSPQIKIKRSITVENNCNSFSKVLIYVCDIFFANEIKRLNSTPDNFVEKKTTVDYVMMSVNRLEIFCQRFEGVV